MTTDLIQSKLYKQSDEQVRAQIGKVLAPLRDWSRAHYGTQIKVGIHPRQLRGQDSTNFDGLWTGEAAAVRTKLETGHALEPMPNLLDALAEAMFNKMYPAARVAHVDAFLAEVARLREDLDNLESRVA